MALDVWGELASHKRSIPGSQGWGILCPTMHVLYVYSTSVRMLAGCVVLARSVVLGQAHFDAWEAIRCVTLHNKSHLKTVTPFSLKYTQAPTQKQGIVTNVHVSGYLGHVHVVWEKATQKKHNLVCVPNTRIQV